ncbi:MAG TPA: FAD-binding domain-containing protein [Herbaspirillum sp.]|uniref:FAD-binding domain-containing protein n=1 Tax=Herbaspirillum sp. TaxID=1890675 RepID=UPI002D2C8AA7|nr:FAD-binding domain-containing protein [Herbaspirillum sp.]HZG19897.1 FAD-binding domain-containing protein [Herbaspirillum sp.]
MSVGLVWFKRDLRLRDHQPLAQAAQCERAFGLFIIEPAWLQSFECDPRHVDFLLRSLQPLQIELRQRGMPLLVRIGEAVQVLEALRREWKLTHLFSHEETGPAWSYARDISVARWSRIQHVHWQEWPQTGVIRRLRSRDGWAARWLQRMEAPQVAMPAGFRAPPGMQPDPLPTLADLGLPTPHLQPPAGEADAWERLRVFLGGAGRDYRRALSSPLTAPDACSRLSAHLAFGTLSMRSVHQATELAIEHTPDRELAYGLRGFSSRLRWHCHFMQKLEDQPDLEWRNIARSLDGLRPGDGGPWGALAQERFDAWCEGRTGYPMVDACMRQLCSTGWLNFRMRAMLVSFAAYHLWLHWRAPGLFLARQFLDFEPGIHWSQMQMQSGTTGINTLRIYSPAKQARDHDPLGEYVRRWVPEYGTPAYPAPIVDEKSALAQAKEALYGHRHSPVARQEADAIQDRHGSRKSGLPATTQRRGRKKTVDPGQGVLF